MNLKKAGYAILRSNWILLMYFLFYLIIEVYSFVVLKIGILPEYLFLNFSIIAVIYLVLKLIDKPKVTMFTINLFLLIQILITFTNIIVNHVHGYLVTFEMFLMVKEGLNFISYAFQFLFHLLILISILVLFNITCFHLRNSKFMQSNSDTNIIIDGRSKLNVSIQVLIMSLFLANTCLFGKFLTLANSRSENNTEDSLDVSNLYSNIYNAKKAYELFGTYGMYTKNLGNIISDAWPKSQASIDRTVAEIDEYFSEAGGIATPTDHNASLEGYNVILILAESLEEFALADEELTPNIAYMKNHSIALNNYYNDSLTIHAETAFITSSVNYSKLIYSQNYRNYFPTALPNILKNEGYQSNAFHNNTRSFYDRDRAYPSLGFESFTALNENGWGKLDSDFISSNIAEIIPSATNKPFFSYWASMGVHGPFNTLRESLTEYYERIEDDPRFVDDQIFLTYQAAVMDFDKSLGLLIERLKETDQLDNTIIAVLADHNSHSGAGLSERMKDVYDQHDSNLHKIPGYIFSTSFSERIDINKYVANLDILPTILDLLGVEFNKAWYAGTSVFNEEETVSIIWKMAVMNDKMYIDGGDIAWYDANELKDPLEYKRLMLSVLERQKIVEKIYQIDYYKRSNVWKM